MSVFRQPESGAVMLPAGVPPRQRCALATSLLLHWTVHAAHRRKHYGIYAPMEVAENQLLSCSSRIV